MEPEKKVNGILIAVIIVAIAICAGYFLWPSKTNNSVKEIPVTNTTTTTTKTEKAPATDTDELDALDKDLKAADTDLGVDVNSIN